MIKDIKYTQSISCEGYLKKERPGLISIYQTRFYTIRDKGNFLVWFKNKPTRPNQHPQGIVTIAQIEKIIPNEKDKTIFQIFYPGRTFILKAESQEDKEKWISSLEYILQYKQKYKNQLQDNRISRGSGQKKNSWRWPNADQNVIHKVQLQNEEIMMDDLEEQQEIISPQRNKQIMISKKLVINLDNQESMERIVTGFLYKKGKLANLTKFKLRWFFMVSDFNLKNLKDKKRLTLNQFPDWVKINTIYYFSPNENDQQFRGNIRLDSILQMNMDLLQSPFKLILKTAERQYTFGSKYLSEIKKWEDSIRAVTDRWKAQLDYNQTKIRVFKSIQSILFESDVKYNGKNSYLIVKQNSLILLKQKDSYKTNQSKLVEFTEISTSQQNKKQLKINGQVNLKIYFYDEDDCQRVQKILLQAQRKSMQVKKKQQVETTLKKSIQFDQTIEKQDNRNTYLGRRLIQNQNKATKNFYKLYAMGLDNDLQAQQLGEVRQKQIIQSSKKVQKQQNVGFFSRLSMMFCGGSSD